MAQALSRVLRSTRPDAAQGIELSHDQRSHYLTDYFQGEGRFDGFTLSFAFVVEPRTTCEVERFNRTLEEQIIHGHTCKNREEITAALSAFASPYNRERRLEKLRYRRPFAARHDRRTSLLLPA